MVPKLIGSKVVRETIIYINMNLNFMHILADVGFDGVFPVYWVNGRKECSVYIFLKGIR
jgi:hypothetical protein